MTMSGLYYKSGEEVQLGDKVRMKRLLRSAIEGEICYIPGISEKHDDLEYEDVKQWAIKANDGAVYPILYDPGNFQPPSKIEFRQRGHQSSLDPAEELT